MSAGPVPHIVFSHGNSFPAGTYNVLLRHLRAHGYTVSALDKFGHDPRYPVTNNWPHLVRQLVDFTPGRTAHAGGTPTFFVGHSLGGILSVMAAAQNPGLVQGVVVLDSPLVSGWRARALGLLKQSRLVAHLPPGKISRKRRNHWPDQDTAWAHFHTKPLFQQWEPQVLQDYIDHGTFEHQGQRVLAFDRQVETAIYNTLPHHLHSLLRRHPLQCPVAFIGGHQSVEVRQAGLALTRKITQGRMTMLDGSHLFPMEKPQETAAHIEAALRSMT